MPIYVEDFSNLKVEVRVRFLSDETEVVSAVGWKHIPPVQGMWSNLKAVAFWTNSAFTQAFGEALHAMEGLVRQLQEAGDE